MMISLARVVLICLKNLQLPFDDKTSARKCCSDLGSCRRRLSDEYNQMGLRNKLEEGLEWDPFEVMFLLEWKKDLKLLGVRTRERKKRWMIVACEAVRDLLRVRAGYSLHVSAFQKFGVPM